MHEHEHENVLAILGFLTMAQWLEKFTENPLETRSGGVETLI
jgi:hypothetical protein